MITAWALAVSAIVAAATDADLIVTDPAALAALATTHALDVGTVAFATRGVTTNDGFDKDTAYGDLVDTLRADVGEMYAGDKAYGVGMRYTHRGFDPAWLRSKDSRWELVAVVNRVDRRSFDPGTCGEARAIYRLAYTTSATEGALDSRLPATLNVVFTIPDDHARCSSAAEHLVDFIAPGNLKAVELDVQTVRWPSTIRPDLGGHAEYVLRVFHKSKDGHLVAAPLEDTPDVARIQKDPALKRDLLAWLAIHARDVDDGVLVVPDKFLATRAVSVTPRGLARPQNRPWTRLLTVGDVTAMAPASPRAFLRRLDGLTCMGCHQSRSIAGFHVVGLERDPQKTVDALAVGISPHMAEDLPRRRAYVDALMRGVQPDERRRPPDHETDAGGFGAACGLGDPGFASWTCAVGSACVAVDDDLVGECLPTPAGVGAACQTGNVDFARDRIPSSSAQKCPSDAVCEDVSVGFPGGMCAAGCTTSDEHAACGAIALLTPFNDCLAHGEPFATCAKLSRPAALRSCGADDPCRPDYLCARATTTTNVCLPPYFVLQMRVDGHLLGRAHPHTAPRVSH